MGKVKKALSDIALDDMPKPSRAFSDRLRQMSLTLGYNKQDDMYECRYEERYGEYTLKTWRDGHEVSHRGYVDNLPEWLSVIRDVATVGGHLKRIAVPPPDNIVWFTTDDDKKLIDFVELK
jgi:hypothetical protein